MSGIANISMMALTLLATATITALRFVTATGAQTGAGGNALGVAAMDAASGEDFTADAAGLITVEAGGAVTAGGLVESDASGRAINKAAGVAVARSLDASTTSGERIRVMLIPN
ncbi:MAG: DUF2190 family protein [Porticoccaceae bacterium]|nr:DUF2190 family protein [Porticoccaceae bacterium]